MELKGQHLYEFGPFVLDTAQHTLVRQGNPVALTPKTYDLLRLLVENRERILLKEELMRNLWQGTFVEESNLTQQVSAVRKVLGETAGEDRYIVTVPGKGYRFVAEVKVPEPERARPGFSRIRALVLAGAVLVAVVAGYLLQVRRTEAGLRSLAILPFRSLTANTEDDFLGLSLADAVITKLGAVSSLTVRPSSAVEKYRHQPQDVRAAAADLRVDTVLTGNYLRDGNDLRITTQLIDVKTQNLLWKRTFDLKYDRLLTVQDNVAHEIVSGLQLSLSPREAESLRPEKAVDPIAYEYYLRGVDLYARDEFPTAIRMLRRSADIDGGYGLTWAHLGRSLTANASFELGGRDQYREAEQAYQKALSLQPALIEAQIYMANLFTDTGQVERAVPLLRQALQTNANHAEAHWEMGYANRFGGRLKESVEQCERARQLDPGVKLTSSALNGYLYLGEYDKFLQSLPKDSDSALIQFYLGFGEYHRKNTREAMKYFDAAFELRPSLLQARVGKALSDGI